MPDVEFTYGTWGEHKELLMITGETVKFKVSYFFDKNNKSIFTTIEPFSQGLLQTTVERYNNKYVIINNTNWKFYADGIVYLCELVRADAGAYYFLWSIDQ